MHFIQAGPLGMVGQVVHLTKYQYYYLAVYSNHAQGELHLRLCALWSGRVQLTCAFDPSLCQQSNSNYSSFSLIIPYFTWPNSPKSSKQFP